MLKILSFIDKYLHLGLIFLYPIFFLPLFVNPYSTSKLLLLVVVVLILALIKIVKTFFSDGLEFNSSKIDILVILLSLIYLLTGIFVTPNKFDALFAPGTSSFVVFG